MRAGSVFNICKQIIAITALGCLVAVMPVQAALEDPTRPPTAKATNYASPKKNHRPRWVLTSTLVSSQRRTAVINDKVVARGDRINGARVVSIQPSVVRLRIGARDITLMMLKKNIKSLSQVATSRHRK
jgi:hypothetical protein